MNAIFIIYKDDEVGLEYVNKLTTRVMEKKLGTVLWTAKFDEKNLPYFEYRFDIDNQNLLLL